MTHLQRTLDSFECHITAPDDDQRNSQSHRKPRAIRVDPSCTRMREAVRPTHEARLPLLLRERVVRIDCRSKLKPPGARNEKSRRKLCKQLWRVNGIDQRVLWICIAKISRLPAGRPTRFPVGAGRMVIPFSGPAKEAESPPNMFPTDAQRIPAQPGLEGYASETTRWTSRSTFRLQNSRRAQYAVDSIL